MIMCGIEFVLYMTTAAQFFFSIFFLRFFNTATVNKKKTENKPKKVILYISNEVFFRLSHDVVTSDVDRDVSTAYC